MVRKLERYELIEEIGHGGMAVVYRGRDSQLERSVAVKVLHPHLQSQPESKQRFHREAKAVARLRHRNIPEIYDYSGADAPESYIVTELISGPTLKRFVEDHPGMPVEVAASIVIEVCRALEHAHAQGIIHRDVKPENVMIAADGVVKLTDFGIAHMLDSHSMTVTGQILGSPAHMSPEHLEGKALDFRADVFSVGTVLYWLATGRLPFEGRNPHQVLKKIFDGDYPEPLRVRPQMGEQLAVVIRRCLALDPSERYPTVTALREDLEAFLRELDVDPELLGRYFADPAGVTARHDAQILGTLVRKGAAALRAGERPRATVLFNRALAIDSQNPEVLRHVRAMVRRRRTSWIAGSAALACLVVALGWAAWPAGGRARAARPGTVDHRDGASSGSRSSRVAQVTVPAKATPQTPIGPEPGGDRGTAKARHVEPAASSVRGAVPLHADTERVVRFVAGTVRNFDIWIDGVRLGTFGPDLQTRSLAVGPHAFRFVGAGDCCQDAVWSENVIEGEGEQRVGRNLQYRPALLSVETNVHADIEVTGRAQGRSGAFFEVPLRQYTDTLRVVARADGYRSAETVVELSPNQRLSVRLELQPEAAEPPEEPTPPERAKLDPGETP